jgi:hypothetical protein
MKRCLKTLVFLVFAMSFMALPAFAGGEPTALVGRIYQIEGDLLRYLPAEEDWVAVVNDAPFGAGDTLYSGTAGRAELAAPNGSWIRLGNSTQLQFIDLETDLSETDVASGIARFYNKGSLAVIKATSPFGYVLANPGTAFDFYVGENSVEVVAITGEVSFIHSATGARYDVAAGYSSILADQYQVSSGEGTVDPDWDQWNAYREDFRAEKAIVRSRSTEYLPTALQDESYALEENGRWERVPYEGRWRWFWRPTAVAEDWAPFTVGRWTDWSGDQTWIPSEPFGYVTHHYGNWVYVRNNWYWAPPAAKAQIGLPLSGTGFFWNPGRVSWIHSGAYVGWVPLAPRETYYSHRNWGGPHGMIVNNANLTRININIGNYANAKHAIVVNRNNFYGVNNYRKVRVANLNTSTIINNYRAAPVVNNTVIDNYRTNRQRYNYTNVPVSQKPHNTAIKRIRQNETIMQKDNRRENAVMIRQEVKRIPEGRINRESRVALPTITNRIVPVKEVNRPKSEIQFQQKEIKRHGVGATEIRPVQIDRTLKQPVSPVQMRPERLKPAPSAFQEKPVITREPQLSPEIHGQPERPVQIDRTLKQPVRPEQMRPERLKPAPSAFQEKPVLTREPQRVIPEIHRQPERPVQIDRSPKQPVSPVQVRPEHPKPVKPVVETAPEKVKPARQGKQEKSRELEKQEAPH